jgi:hypothetical protein
MAKYFVKKHCEATETLCIATDRIQDYYYGKNTEGGYVCKNREPAYYESALYGLDSQQEAEELISKMQPFANTETTAGSWSVALSIVEVEDA